MHRSYVCLSKRTAFCSFSLTLPLLHFFFLALPPPPPPLLGAAFFLSSFFGGICEGGGKASSVRGVQVWRFGAEGERAVGGW